MTQESYSLVLGFKDQSQSFVLGFEFGRLWLRMTNQELEIREVVHSENREIIEAAGKELWYTVEWEPAGDHDWVFVNLKKSEKPCHLKLVK